MRLLDRIAHRRDAEPDVAPDDLPEEAPRPQPEHHEPRLEDPGPTDLARADYVAIVKRAFREASNDHIGQMAAALAYYAFLAIPSMLLITLGVFGLVASPDTVATVVEKAGEVAPAEAQTLLRDSLTRMTETESTSATLIGLGGLLALWSVGGAMQNLIWALNVAYDRDESRGFVRRRLASWSMAFFALIGFALTFGLLVLGPALSTWIGEWLDAETLVNAVWWIAQWPILIAGLLLTFAAILYLGPNVNHPRWRFLTFGAIFSVAIWLLASGAFAFYVSQFGSYNKAWGTLSAVVIMLTWLWLSAAALLLGAEINAEAERSRELRRGEPAEVELQAAQKT